MFLRAVQPFKLELEWLQAQAFRWSEPSGDGWYYGVVHDSLIRVRNSGDGIEFESDASDEALAPHVSHYFRLDQDISTVHQALREADDTGEMGRLIDEHRGMRILRQDRWECLVAYICSQRNKVARIAEIVDHLAKSYGVEHTLRGVRRSAFPAPERLVAAGEAELEELGLGLSRGRRIYAVARDITEGHLNLDELPRFRYPQARGLLTSYEGIGDKIADCVCLFALDKPEAFPIDRRVAEALKRYDKTYNRGARNARLMEWVRRTFGENAGYASQLLFMSQPETPAGDA